jgi:peptidoglycan L-alanyl-D-glutamate endopeptidase CwlK
MPTYHLGDQSQAKLAGVHPDLVRVVGRAIELTAQDFSVIDGVRTLAEQKRYVASGASQTLDSRHLTGHAVDLAAYINGQSRWETVPLCDIAEAVRMAARELNVPIRWGGCWDKLLTECDDAPEDMIHAYQKRRTDAGLKAFIDAPHFELPKILYPSEMPVEAPVVV